MASITGQSTPANRRIQAMKRITFWLLVLLFYKVLISIVLEYRNYFPADFTANFLATRRSYFHGVYQWAFYVHIVSGPIALLVASFLMFSGTRKSLGAWHRRLGKLLTYCVLFLMLPSGVIMANRAFTGPIAGVGFYALSFFTAISVAVAAWHASQRRFAIHQRWATRSFILLCSPLLLRLTTGAAIVLKIDSDWTYRFAAWASWLLPLLAYEFWRQRKRN